MCKEPQAHGRTWYFPHADGPESLGLVDWRTGDVFRPGKTRREEASGQKANYLKNREARRQDNRERAGHGK